MRWSLNIIVTHSTILEVGNEQIFPTIEFPAVELTHVAVYCKRFAVGNAMGHGGANALSFELTVL